MNKKKMLLMLALVAVVLFLVLRYQKSEPNEATESTVTKEAPVDATEAEIVILSVNDMHSNIDMFPKFATMVDSLRAIYPDMMLFSAGDNRTGNPVNDQYDPVNYPMITLMNKVGFDLSAVGNHEWDGNIVNLQNDIERADFPFICANVFIPDNVKLDIKPFVTMQQQGVKMAVVGMIEVRHGNIPGAHPDNLKQVSFKRPEVVLPDYKYLRGENDVVLLLSHCGFEDDVELAQSNPWLDAIIGGHSHTLVDHPSETNGVVITQSGSHLKNATLLKIKDMSLWLYFHTLPNERRLPSMMEAWSRLSSSRKSLRPHKAETTPRLTWNPVLKHTACSLPTSLASFSSSSTWISSVPLRKREPEQLVPYLSMAALAASFNLGSFDRPR